MLNTGVYTTGFKIPKWLLRMDKIESLFNLNQKEIKLNYTIQPKSTLSKITHNITILPTSTVGGYNNTAIGYNSIATGSSNIAIGYNSMYSNCTGSNNVAYGYNAFHSKKYSRKNKVKNIWKKT
jgi:hypothetical protein